MGPRIGYAARLVLLSTGLVSLTVGLTALLVHRAVQEDLARSLADELLAIARSSAALIDADLVELVYLDESGEIALPNEFEALREQLDAVRRGNRLPALENPIYIMRPTAHYGTTGELEFVAMPDPGPDGPHFVGNVYAAREHNRCALAGEACASGIYEDEEGIWISAAAPLYDSSGALVGLVQVDRPVNFFYALARERALAVLRVALISIGAGLVIALLMARGMVGPLRAVVDGLEDLARGDLRRRLSIERNDEIGDVADGFNALAERLEGARAEADTATRALVRSGRLAAVGQLAAGIAHEINNPLTYTRANLTQLSGQVEAVLEKLGEAAQDKAAHLGAEEAREMIEEALEGVDRALGIVRDIKGFAHMGHGELEATDLVPLLEEVIRMATPHADGIAIGVHLSPVPSIPAVGQELKQVFLNLLVNACQALDGNGMIDISTFVAGDHVGVTIQDDGPGIPPEVMECLFDPFFTTKPVGVGTGLGLSISYEIIRRHHGELLVHSEPGCGARFEVRLPR